MAKQGILTSIDIAPYLKEGYVTDATLDRLNEIIDQRVLGKKMMGVLESTVETQRREFPLVTLEVRIREMVRGMVQSLLLDESEVRELAMGAVMEATKAFDWKKEAYKAIEQEMKQAVHQAMDTLRYGVLYDKDVMAAFKKAMIRELSKPEEES